jgi:hypothetical protein
MTFLDVVAFQWLVEVVRRDEHTYIVVQLEAASATAERSFECAASRRGMPPLGCTRRVARTRDTGEGLTVNRELIIVRGCFSRAVEWARPPPDLSPLRFVKPFPATNRDGPSPDLALLPRLTLASL